MDIEKRAQQLTDRLRYIKDIFAGRHAGVIAQLNARLDDFFQNLAEGHLTGSDPLIELGLIEEQFLAAERRLDAELTPMEKVRIVRHPQRICLRDILENVYDNFTEIGGQEEHSIDPSMVIARATITRRRGKKKYNQLIMVIGQEKGHGEEFRNGGSVKPWGNAKARHFMQVAETENIPIHTYVFTPGSYPIEDYPGAAQQIASNLYEMAGLSVPIVAVISEGGSGGAEAIALADRRLMLSHGYYSVISPEGAAAIQGRLKGQGRATPELIAHCAAQLRMTAEDNLNFGYIDRIVQEPYLGARPLHYDFFRTLRQEIIRATDEAVISVRPFSPLRKLTLRRWGRDDVNLDEVYLRWNLSDSAREKLVSKRQKKILRLSRGACIDRRPALNLVRKSLRESWESTSAKLKYVLYTKHQQRLANFFDESVSLALWLKERLLNPFSSKPLRPRLKPETVRELTTLSDWDESESRKGRWAYVSPRAREDRTITCPNAATHGCMDLWAPDLYGEFAGVCTSCGHHFPMEYQWVVNNVFDPGSVREFNTEVESDNPLGFEGLSELLEKARQKTHLKSACVTFEAKLEGTKMIVAMLVANFRGGSVGAAEGQKFVEAAALAEKKHYPFLAYVHGTAGIRIQEGTHGVIQMPRCTVAVRRYIEAGGLYMVLYDTNSYAGPVASFLGCSPYQYAMRSSNLGFAGPGVIKETTGLEIPPHYHSAYKALARGHIQGVWDRREARANLQQLLLTAGGRNLYYR
ncbi:MAG TPA: acetyl-CoA carboxylase carboxyl transferase subunit alpha/beta [Candidatus Avidesulfovibrio excrementigallinarum]|nr:acetyl-CoA carboxylase carboxyl transferase subunit alpha/beta [Candidatus Avidesulfovibrio excrementigallinarum]